MPWVLGCVRRNSQIWQHPSKFRFAIMEVQNWNSSSDLTITDATVTKVRTNSLQRNMVHPKTCNCNYILFTKLPWQGDSEGTFRSSSQAATCPPVYHTRRRLHTIPLIAERQAGKLWIPIFIVFGLTRPRIEPESTASVADALSTQP